MEIKKLIMVTEENNNKFYNMTPMNENQFYVEYGRVGNNYQTKIYSSSEFNKLYASKIKKGYKDVTELQEIAPAVEKDLEIKTTDVHVANLISFIQKAAKGLIKRNYNTSIDQVTQKQIDVAQEIIDELNMLTTYKKDDTNRLLKKLYETIPRQMRRTTDFFVGDIQEIKKTERLIENEQKLLDALKGQVVVASEVKNNTLDLANFGLEIRLATKEEIAEIGEKTDLITQKATRIYRVVNTKTQKDFDEQKSHRFSTKTSLFYHGSRCENWWNILTSGLLIRPAGAKITGSMFGSQAIYFARQARKSLGYTDGGCWNSERSSKKLLGIYEVATGKQWDVFEKGKKRWSNWMSYIDFEQVKAKGYDSVFAQGGADLRNDEFMTYETSQSNIKFLVEFDN